MPYCLENVTSRHSHIYQQMYRYYHFCEHTRGMSTTTMQSKVHILNKFIAISGLKDLRKISNRHIYEWINQQFDRGNSGRSINDRLAHLRAMLRWQQDMNLNMPHLQLALITRVKEAPARKVCFNRREIAQVLSLASQQEWLFIKLAFDCGLRISELRTLRLNNICGNKISIIGKGNKRRYAYLSSEVKHALKNWIRDYTITDYLWPSPILPSSPLAVCTIRQRMQEAFRRAGFDNFCPHDLRHSYATDLKNIGIPTRKIQAGLGHASEATTERYLSDLDGLDLYELYKKKYKANPVNSKIKK